MTASTDTAGSPGPPGDDKPRVGDALRLKPSPPIPKITLKFSSAYSGAPASSRRSPSASVRKAAVHGVRSPAATQRANTSLSPVVADGPIQPPEARDKYQGVLTSYEVSEIDGFPDVYFVGQATKKVRPNGTGDSNFGYDDALRHYRCNCGDHIAYRFEIRSVLGRGAFGQVLRVFDHKTKSHVALKVIVNTKQMHDQGQVEIELLRKLMLADGFDGAGVVQAFDYFMFRHHICVTFEILGPNLFEYARSMRFHALAAAQLRAIARCILTALAFLHRNSVVHCDIKPENLLLIPDSLVDIKLIDFGSSCLIGQHRFEYIQSRFYRAPEVILGRPYGPPMDIWGFGCVIGELAIGKPLFPGASEREQIRLFVEVLGPPPTTFATAGERAKKMFAAGKKRTNLRAYMRTPDADLVDLVARCLDWDQETRISADQALAHPWFAKG